MMSCGYEGLDQDRQPMSSGGNLLGGAAEEGLGEVLGGRGGYGCGYGGGLVSFR
jgi:hypothetical protein